jgi:cytochrome c-type biogenesis protein CcmE
LTTTAPPAAPASPPPGRPPKKKQTRYVVAVAGCLVAVFAVIVLTIVLAENVVYYRTVSEAVKERKDQGSDRFRLAGAVVPGSINERAHSVEFKLTDGKRTVTVVHQGERPALFKKNAPVLCEGKWSAAAVGAPFDSDRILIKHGNEYKPPKVDTKKAPAAESATSS